jgi:hypothetical protein
MSKKKYGQLGGELLLPQKKSRRAIAVGDVFTIKLTTGDYYFGRVISDKADQYPPTEESFYLVYLYNAKSKIKEDIPKLDKNDLLIPPYFTVSQDWTSGYSETIKNISLTEDDVLDQHYFYNPIFKVYNDGFGNVIDKPDSENAIVGQDGLASRALFDKEIRSALGLDMPDW